MAARLVEVFHNPEHWNANCGCTIPEAWEAIVEEPLGIGRQINRVRIMGDTREQVVRLAKEEFPGLTIDTPAGRIA